MRALRVLGLAEAAGNGTIKNLVCEDPVTGEQFSVPCDDRLRAGSRGDLSRFGQLEIELESQLRPREIQAKIRAGATVEQIASLAGTNISRVERFAYPVLLERASMADRAKKARPAIDGITASISVADTVAATLAARGHDGDMKWDAFKDDEGWILTLAWSAGRSENQAQWLFHPGPDGGTLSARDEAAAEIVDPALRILRPLRPVRPDTASSVFDPTIPTELPADKSTGRFRETGARSAHPAGSKLPAALSSPLTRSGNSFGDLPVGRNRSFGVPVDNVQDHHSADRVGPERGTVDDGSIDRPTVRLGNAERLVEDDVIDERSAVHPIITRHEAARTGTESARPALTAAAPSSTSPAPLPSAAAPAPSAPGAAPHGSAGGPPKSARKGQRPSMPSWEDVLLGTRSNNGH